MPATATQTSADVIAALTAHTWTPQPEPAQLVQQVLAESLDRCSFLAELSQRMLTETGTRLVDWLGRVRARPGVQAALAMPDRTNPALRTFSGDAR